MNLEQLRESGYIVYECVSGSKAYGTDVEGSDTDIRGIFILPTEEVLSGRYIPQISDKMNDITFYEIGNFIELACKGNPNILELLNVDSENVIFKDPAFDTYLDEEFNTKVLTTKLKHSFTGYAFAQIKKAKGLKKKINWDKTKVTRKDILDFCYVLNKKEESLKFKKWKEVYNQTSSLLTNFDLVDEWNLGLANVNNFKGIYSMYYMPEGGGFISDIGNESNSVQIRSIPKMAPHIGYIKFDKEAYSTHCKDYREYTEWLENRNPERYRDNLKGEQGYDHKNMLHCIRLLNMARDIAEGRGIVVRRPEREYLLQIRNGEIKYDELLEKAETMVEEINNLFDGAGLPREVKTKYRQELLLKIRKDYYGE